MLRFRRTALIFFLVLSTAAFAESADKTGLRARLDPLVKAAGLKSGTFGIDVRELHSGSVLYSTGADTPLNPASAIKVLVSAAALSLLGPDHRFETTVSASGADLCLIGGGDPSMVTETLWKLVEEMRFRDLLKISGDVILEAGLFATSRPPGFSGDAARAFTAPVSPLSLNFNSLTVHGYPTAAGRPARVAVEPSMPGTTVRNETVTVANASRRDMGADLSLKDDRFSLRVFGSVGQNLERASIYRSVPSPEIYFGRVFASLLSEAGGSIGGKLRTGSCPAGAREIFRFRSKPLSLVLFDLNKFSNNFIAEMLLAAVGPGTSTEAGIEALKAWLRDSGIETPGMVLENASGLSRRNRITAAALSSIVRKASTDLKTGPEFLASMGIAGTDGTMRSRMKGSPAEWNVRAKSGSLKDVVSLTGVAQREEGEPVVFTFLFNSVSKRAWDMQRLEESLLDAVVSLRKR